MTIIKKEFRKVKILHFINALTYGGAQSYLKSIVASPFLRERYSFSVLSFKDGPLRGELEKLGIKCYLLNFPKDFDFILPFAGLKSIFQKFDLIHLHLGKASFYGKLTQFLYGKIPTITTYHGLEKKRYTFFDKFFYLWSDYHLFVSYYLKSHPDFSHLPQGISSVLYPTSSLEMEENTIKSEKEKMILWCGRLEENKGIDLLEKIVDSLLKCSWFNEWRIAIVGEGKYKNYFKNKYEGKRVIFPPLKEKEEFYQKSRLLFHTSREEALGIVLIDALKSETPVVAFNIGGVREVVIPEKTGFLVKPYSISHFLNVLKTALLFPFKSEIIRDFYQRKFSSKLLFKGIDSVYQKVLTNFNTQKTKKRILYFVSSSSFGGGEENAYLLAKNLSSRFEPVFLIKSALSSPFLEKLKETDWEVHQWKIGDNFDILTLLKLPFLVKARRISCVHSHLNRAAILSFLVREKLISTVHGINRGIYYRFSQKVIAVSEEAKKHLIKEGVSKDKIKVIRNFVPIYPWKNEKRYSPNLIAVSRFHPKKRLDLSLKILKELKNKTKDDWKLFLVGDGELRENLKKMTKKLGIETSVIFTGYQKDVKVFLEKATFFLLPSEVESCPLSLLEAMERGVIPIINDLPSLREMIREDYFFGKNSDLKTYVDKILDFWQNKDKLEKASSKVRKLVEEKFNPKIIMKKYEKLYYNC